MWMNGQTDTKKLIVAFRNFANSPRGTLKLHINICAARWKSQSLGVKIYVSCQYKILKL